MNEPVCKCCGQTLPVVPEVKIPPGYWHLFRAVCKAGKEGIRSDRLFSLEYSGTHDGGPDYKTLSARIHYLNKRHLAKQGWRIVGEITGSREHGHYRLINVV
jgi:hypothetical protein